VIRTDARIEPGATLGGSGTILGSVTNAGGTIAPGGSIGVLTARSYRETAPSTHLFEIDAAGNHDQLTLEGTHSLFAGDSESLLQIWAQPGDYTLGGQTWDIIVAGDGLSGTFDPDRIEVLGANAKLFLEYQPDSILLTSVPLFWRPTSTPNQSSTGAYLDDVTPAGLCDTDLCSFASELGASSYMPDDLDQLHPEVYDAYLTSAFSQARLFSEAARWRSSTLRQVVRPQSLVRSTGPMPAESAPLSSSKVSSDAISELKPASSKEVPVASNLLAIEELNTGGGLLLHLIANGPVSAATTLTLEDPDRLVIDLLGLVSELAQSRHYLGSDHVKRIRVGQHADMVRVVVDAGVVPNAFDGRRLIPVADGLLIALGSGDALDAAVADARRTPGSRRLAAKRPRPNSSSAPPVARRHAKGAHHAPIEEGKVNAWVQGLGALAERNTGVGHVDYDYDTTGVIAGLDFRIGEKLLVGGMGGWARTDIDWLGRQGDGQADVAQFGAYASYTDRGWFVDGVFGYGLNWFDTKRGIVIDGMDRMAQSDHQGDQMILRAGGGRLFDVWRGLGLEPTVDVEWLRVDQDSITETGAGDISLEVADRQADSLRTLVGLRMVKRFALGKSVSLQPEVRAGWSHEFLDDNRTLSAGFAGQASRFLVRGSHTARDGAVVDAALNLFLGRNVSLRAEYLGGFSSSDTLHGVTLGLRGRFPWEAR